MSGSKLIRLDNDEQTLVCIYCHAPVMSDGGFVPCACVRAQWGGVSVGGTGLEKAKSPGQRKARDAAREFVKQWPSGRGLYLYGPTGTGKTHIANGIVRAIIEKGATACLWDMPELLANCKAGISEGGDSTIESYYEDAMNVKLLVLDDFAAERPTEYAADIMLGIIGRRDRSGRPLIVTSNLSPDMLRKTVDARVASRIFGMCDPIPVLGTDLRRGGAA